MPNLAGYNRQIANLRKTTRIMQTMRMVAASKLYRAVEQQRRIADLTGRTSRAVARLLTCHGPFDHPYQRDSGQPHRPHVVVFSSDRGLCGSFNANVVRHVQAMMAAPLRRGQQFAFSFCGSRAYRALRSRVQTVRHYDGLAARPAMEAAGTVAADIEQGFRSGEFDAVYLAYNRFEGTLAHRPSLLHVLPIDADDLAVPGCGPASPLLTEPGPEALFRRLAPLLLRLDVLCALVDTHAGENGARMAAMDSAVTNARHLTDRLVLQRNRARQALITTELTEIVAGAEALHT
jgi:F-type H+-transporting ATPase subunit gamma